MITSEVLSYIRERNLLDGKDLVEGEVRVFNASRRNRNFRIVNSRGISLFLKEGGLQGISSIAREAAVYSMLQPFDASPLNYKYAPRMLDYNPDRDILVLELCENALDLREYQRLRKVAGYRAASMVGKALALLHQSIPLTKALDLLGESAPGVLDVDKPGIALLCDFSGSSIDLIRMVQSSKELLEQLDAMRNDWKSDSLVHNDVRMDNILTAGNGPAPGIVIVDWETASCGDAAWDVGAAIADYLSLWLLSIPIAGRQSPEKLAHLAASPLSVVQAPIAALWYAYLEESKMTIGMENQFLLRVVRYCGLKLIQSAIEMVQNSAHWNLTAVALLQVATNMMLRPEDASKTLLGLEVAA